MTNQTVQSFESTKRICKPLAVLIEKKKEWGGKKISQENERYD